MTFNLEKINVKTIASWICLYVILAFGLACFGTVLGFPVAFGTNLFITVFTCILTTLLVMGLLCVVGPKPLTIRMVLTFLGVVVGVYIGQFISLNLTGLIKETWIHEKGWYWGGYAIGVVIMCVPFGFGFYTHIIKQISQKITEQRINRILFEKMEMETRIRILQAQIEPHFLFNTLSNILSMFQYDLSKAKMMQDDLIRYLESSWSNMRSSSSTIGLEMEMIQSYLNIQRIRMGDRLQFRISGAESLKDTPFPPMLIQPLVENALKHGLEPKLEGGSIHIHIENTREKLIVAIADTGLGFKSDSRMNVGITNTMERIDILFNGRGQLILEENTPCGIKAIIEVTHANNDSDYRR